MADPVDTLTGKLTAAQAEAERGLAYAHQVEENGRALAFEIEKLLAENQRLWSRLETRTAEANRYALENERLRATLTNTRAVQAACIAAERSEITRLRDALTVIAGGGVNATVLMAAAQQALARDKST